MSLLASNLIKIAVKDNNSYILHIINKIMKVNRKVSDLARKLDYIGIPSEKRRDMIKTCLNPIDKLLGRYNVINQIDRSYEKIKIIKEEMAIRNRIYQEKKKEFQKYLDYFN
jgi:hypothetical protein